MFDADTVSCWGTVVPYIGKWDPDHLQYMFVLEDVMPRAVGDSHHVVPAVTLHVGCGQGECAPRIVFDVN